LNDYNVLVVNMMESVSFMRS